MTPDLTEARRLLDRGFNLVKLIGKTKQPEGKDWNSPHRRVTRIDDRATGYGFPLTANNRCSVDPDHLEWATKGMAALGFDLEEVMAAGVRTKSTRPNSGGRSMFVSQPGLTWLKFNVKTPTASNPKKSTAVLELRAHSPNLQDVVPGLVYKDKEDALCTQFYAGELRMDDECQMPEKLAAWWHRCSTDIGFLHAQQKLFAEAIGQPPVFANSVGGKLAFEATGYRMEFNKRHAVEDFLLDHGYEQYGERWTHPGATGAPGIRKIPGKDDLWQSDHGGDPLSGTFDAWSCFVQLEHDGDVEAAIAAFQTQLDGDTAKHFHNLDYEGWPDPVDPHREYSAPPFPLDALPNAMAEFCRQEANRSGFDVGAYAFSTLVMVSGLIDQRCRIHCGPMTMPPLLWGALVAPSGGGKSPILKTVMKPLNAINGRLMEKSKAEMQKRREEALKAEPSGGALHGPIPPNRQLVVTDTTVEALAEILLDNPTGVVVFVDELTEWLGRMDAYGGSGQGKDRGKYLSAYDGNQVTINRVQRAPVLVPNFAVSILTGIQPEKLADLFRRHGGGSADGLYQRFLMYSVAPAGRVNYSEGAFNEFISVDYEEMIEGVVRLTQNREIRSLRLSREASRVMERYHQSMRDLAQSTPQMRFAEHLDKFPGMAARMAFTLHVMREVAGEGAYDLSGQMPIEVDVDTVQRALKIMRVLFRHSEAVYEVLDAQVGATSKLTKSACEAIC